jgi:hypothetical protein
MAATASPISTKLGTSPIGDPDGHNIEIAYKPWLYK